MLFFSPSYFPHRKFYKNSPKTLINIDKPELPKAHLKPDSQIPSPRDVLRPFPKSPNFKIQSFNKTYSGTCWCFTELPLPSPSPFTQIKNPQNDLKRTAHFFIFFHRTQNSSQLSFLSKITKDKKIPIGGFFVLEIETRHGPRLENFLTPREINFIFQH